MRRLASSGRNVAAIALALACAGTLVARAATAVPQTPAAATTPKTTKPAATAPAPSKAKPAPAVRTSSSRPLTHPLTLDTQNIEGKAEGARVLFIHMAPNIALEDAPKHPSYLRDDFTAALSSPVRLVVRPYPPLVLTPATGGNR
jgi:hypothetical protein